MLVRRWAEKGALTFCACVKRLGGGEAERGTRSSTRVRVPFFFPPPWPARSRGRAGAAHALGGGSGGGLLWSPFFVALLGNPGAGAAAGVRPLRWGWGRTRPSAAPRPQRALLDPCFENPPRAAFSGKIRPPARPPPPPSPQGPSPPSPSPPRNRRAFAAFSSLAILPAFLPILIPDRGAGGSPRAGLPCQTPPFPHPVPWKSGLLLPRLGRDPAAGPREIRAGQPRPSRPGPARPGDPTLRPPFPRFCPLQHSLAPLGS